MRPADPGEVGQVSKAELPTEEGAEEMKNGKVIATVVSIFVLVAMFFGGFFILEARFCSNVRATAAESQIDDNDTAIDELGRKVDRQIIADYRRQVRELEFEYGSPANMPDKIRKYYFWLKDELARLLAEQQS